MPIFPFRFRIQMTCLFFQRYNLQVPIAFVFAHFALCIQISLNFHSIYSCAYVHARFSYETYIYTYAIRLENIPERFFSTNKRSTACQWKKCDENIPRVEFPAFSIIIFVERSLTMQSFDDALFFFQEKISERAEPFKCFTKGRVHVWVNVVLRGISISFHNCAGHA